MPARGKLITVEGTEGVGKSTNIAFIKQRIEQAGFSVVETREPGGTPMAEDIRNLLLTPREEKVAGLTELLLMFAARAQHIEQVIEPSLQAGHWVLSDRFTDASIAYQGYGRGLSIDTINTLASIVQGSLQADCTFLLDIDVRIGIERAKSRAELDRFEQEQLSFFNRVRHGYLELAKAQPARFRVVDAALPLDGVQSMIAAHLDMLINDLTGNDKTP